MDEGVDLFNVILILGYLVALGWYIYYVWNKRKFKEKSRSWGHRVGESRKSGRRRGKRCPQCNNVIDQRRTLCHHCGHEFEPAPGIDPHPDEIASGRRQAPDQDQQATG